MMLDKNGVRMDAVEELQLSVSEWVEAAFGKEVATNTYERNHRFLEEALELVQSLDCTREEAHMLVDYVFNRPKGDPFQEVGGVGMTLMALCNAANLDARNAVFTELDRCWDKIEAIRAKQLTKPDSSPLPGKYPDDPD